MPQVIALVQDLMFLSRVREAARGLDLEVKVYRRRPPDAVDPDARLVVVDLDRFGDPDTLLRLRSAPGLAGVPLVGFLSHVDADRARQAGKRAARASWLGALSSPELPQLMSDATHRAGENPS